MMNFYPLEQLMAFYSELSPYIGSMPDQSKLGLAKQIRQAKPMQLSVSVMVVLCHVAAFHFGTCD